MINSSQSISEKAFQSRLACKRLIQYIHEHGLSKGDVMPPQEQLRQQFGFGHATLSKAMGMLVEYGMVTRKTRVGTVVADCNVVIPDLWTVGIPIFSHEKPNDLFIDTLLRCLQTELIEAGCRWKCYMRRREPEDEKAYIADFPGLDEDIKQGAIDGMLSPTLLHEADAVKLQNDGFPVCQVLSLESFNCGVGINTAPMIQKAVTGLLAEGCQHLALISGQGIVDKRQAGTRKTFQVTLQERAAAHIQAELLAISSVAVTRQAGRQIAQSILARPPQQRPDGVIILADVLAIGFSEICTQSGYRPQLVVQTNKQVPVLFGVPAICFEVDVPQMAHTGAKMILERLCNPLLDNEKKWMVPERKENDLHEEEGFTITRMPVELAA